MEERLAMPVGCVLLLLYITVRSGRGVGGRGSAELERKRGKEMETIGSRK